MAASMCNVGKTLKCLCTAHSINNHNGLIFLSASYAKKVGGITSKVGGKSATAGPPKLRLAPETDPAKLTRFLCGGNITREGGVDPELKPESEYPDWLWTLRTDRGLPSLEDLDPNSWQYWRQMRTMNTKRRLSSMRDRFKYRRF